MTCSHGITNDLFSWQTSFGGGITIPGFNDPKEEAFRRECRESRKCSPFPTAF